MTGPVPTTEAVRAQATRMAAIRAGFGLAAILAPDLSARLLGYPPAHVNPTGRIFDGLFGVRELALAATVLWARDDERALHAAFALNAACDVADAGVAARALLRREGVDRGALLTIAPALVGATGWIALRRRLTR